MFSRVSGAPKAALMLLFGLCVSLCCGLMSSGCVGGETAPEDKPGPMIVKAKCFQPDWATFQVAEASFPGRVADELLNVGVYGDNGFDLFDQGSGYRLWRMHNVFVTDGRVSAACEPSPANAQPAVVVFSLP